MVTLLTTTLIVTFALSLFFGGFYLKDIKGLWISGVGTGLLIIFGTLILSVSPIEQLVGQHDHYVYSDNFSDMTHWEASNPPPGNPGVWLFHIDEEKEYAPLNTLMNYALGVIFLLLGLGGLFQVSETYNTMKLNISEKEIHD